jgi:hypothetical protein
MPLKSGYNTLNYEEQGGEVWGVGGSVEVLDGGDIAVESGGSITVAEGGTLTVDGVTIDETTLAMTGLTASAAEINSACDGVPANITFAAAAGAANVAEVTCTVKDAAGATLAGVFVFDLWLSDAATGAGLTGTTASGAVTAKAASGADFGALTAKKALRVQTLATGVFVLSITDSAKTGFYVAAQVPGKGNTVVSAQLVTGNYG